MTTRFAELRAALRRAGVERLGAFARNALLLHDHRIVERGDDRLELVDLVTRDEDEARTVLTDGLVLGSRQVDALDAVGAAALAEVRLIS